MTGSGTLADPYIISDVNDLQAVENDLTAYYELGNDIDASATSGWNAGAGFVPIGQAPSRFTGSFDGKGFIITDLFINLGGNAALFLVNYGTIQNVGLVDCNITGFSCASIVVWNMPTGTITKCYATGTVTTVGGNAGGFVSSDAGTIQDCYTRCAVVGTGAASWAGGFVESEEGAIDNCYSTGAVSGIYCGGFCNYLFGAGTITDSFWDTETSGQAASDGGTGKTTAQMKTESTFTDAGWDFTTPIWYINSTINDGYPAFIGVARIKGNPIIDQIIYHHVERMD